MLLAAALITKITARVQKNRNKTVALTRLLMTRNKIPE
jgi:hypothetical protein